MKFSIEYILLISILGIFMYRVYAWKQVFKESLSDQSKILKEKNSEISKSCSELLQQALRKFNEHRFTGRGILLQIGNNQSHNAGFSTRELEDTLKSMESLYFQSLTSSPEVRSCTRITYQIIAYIKVLHENKTIYLRKDHFYHFVYLSLNLIFESLKASVSISKPNLIVPKSRYGRELAKYTVGENKDFFSETEYLAENNPLSHIFAAFYFEVLKKIPDIHIAFFKAFFNKMGYDNSILLVDMALTKLSFTRMLRDKSGVRMSGEKFDIGAIAQRERMNTGLAENNKIEIFYTGFVFKRNDDNKKIIEELKKFYVESEAEISVVSEDLGIISVKLPKKICIEWYNERSIEIDYSIWEISGRSPAHFYVINLVNHIKSPVLSIVNSINEKIKKQFKSQEF